MWKWNLQSFRLLWTLFFSQIHTINLLALQKRLRQKNTHPITNHTQTHFGPPKREQLNEITRRNEWQKWNCNSFRGREKKCRFFMRISPHFALNEIFLILFTRKLRGESTKMLQRIVVWTEGAGVTAEAPDNMVHCFIFMLIYTLASALCRYVSWLLCWMFHFHSTTMNHAMLAALFLFSSRIRILFGGNNERGTTANVYIKSFHSACDLSVADVHAPRRVPYGSWLFRFIIRCWDMEIWGRLASISWHTSHSCRLQTLSFANAQHTIHLTWCYIPSAVAAPRHNCLFLYIFQWSFFPFSM